MGSQRKARTIGEVVFGHYRVAETITSGKGMSNVYLCADTNLNGRPVILKEITRSEGRKAALEYSSLVNEAKILSDLNFHGIPRIIHMVGITPMEDTVSIIMDYLPGVDLGQVISQSPQGIDEDVAVQYMLGVANILDYLHSRPRPIFYRDLKPSNIMVDDASVSLLDYGIALRTSGPGQKLTESLGTKGFAAPEQLKGNLVDLRSDIYAFGVTLFTSVTGVVPTTLPKGASFNILEHNPSLSSGLAQIVLRCTTQDPAQRYQTVAELISDLQNYHYLDNEYRASLRRKRRTIWGTAALAVLLSASGVGSYAYGTYVNNSQYSAQLEAAKVSDNVDAFVQALRLNPTDVDGYLPLVQLIQSDGKFTPQEEASLLSVIQPNIERLRAQPGYPELAFKLGQTYWFFYEGNTSGEVLSAPWFQDATVSQENGQAAEVFFNMAQFSATINSAVKTSSDGGMYLMYWENLVSAQQIANGELMELQLNNRIADTIINYAFRLRVDGLSREDLQAQVDHLQEFLSVSKPTSEAAVKLHEELQVKLAQLPPIVDAAYQSMVDVTEAN